MNEPGKSVVLPNPGEITKLLETVRESFAEISTPADNELFDSGKKRVFFEEISAKGPIIQNQLDMYRRNSQRAEKQNQARFQEEEDKC